MILKKITILSFMINSILFSKDISPDFNHLRNEFSDKSLDLTIIGNIRNDDGIGRITAILLEELGKELKINLIRIGEQPKEDISLFVQNILDQKNDKFAPICLTTYIPWNNHGFNIESYLPKSEIKIAISMTETSSISKKWVEILNKNFDIVLVPDNDTLKIYEEAGIKTVIIVLPIPIQLVKYQNAKIFRDSNKEKFIFGMTSSIWPHKNQELLIDAFAKEFGNNNKVTLIIHSREQFIPTFYSDLIYKKIEEVKSKNIVFHYKTFSEKEHIDFLGSLDCYVLLSKGEGFSITPREALSMGIPTILSNNTAHKELCASGYFYGIKSDIVDIPMHYKYFFGEDYSGIQFNCNVDDVRKGLREVYENYSFYKNIANDGRKYINQYDFSHIKNKYLSLIRPKKIIFDKINKVTDDSLYINSEKLYIKYKKILGFM